MKNKLVPIIIIVVLVVGGITGIVLANVIGKDDREIVELEGSRVSLDTSAAESALEEENLLPEDVSIPDIGADTSDPVIDIETDEDFNDGDFYTYFLDFSLFFHDELKGVDDLRSISGSNWLTAAFIANYTWAADYGKGIEYPYDDAGHALIPLTRLSEACEEILGFPYDFAELAAGQYGSMIEGGNFVVPDGYDLLGMPYADLSTAQLSVKGNTITLGVTVVQDDLDSPGGDVTPYGNYLYTFTIDSSQEIIPYRLVSIVKT